MVHPGTGSDLTPKTNRQHIASFLQIHYYKDATDVLLFSLKSDKSKARQVYLDSTIQTQGNSKSFTGAYKLH